MMPLVRLLLPWLGLAAIPLAILLGLEKMHHGKTRSQLAAVQRTLTAEQMAHRQTVINYHNAAEEARRRDAENQARVQAEQTATTERIEREYEARLADARARADRLRQQLEAAAGPGSPRAAPMPGLPGSPGGPDGAAPDHRLSLHERLIATEQALQLDSLQRWIREQSRIEFSGNSSRSPTANR